MNNHYILKTYCRKIFLIGSGSYWFEDNTVGDDKRLFYRVCGTLQYCLYVSMTVLEIMAAVLGNFPEDEQRDSVSLSVSHTIVVIKMSTVMYNRERIKILCSKMIEVCKPYEDEKLMMKKYKIIKINVIAYFINVFSSMACFIGEGLRKLNAGMHFVTVVTYYPTYENNSISASAFRIFTTIVFFIMMITMVVAVDTFTMVFFIMYKYKIITLKRYFERLREEFDDLNNKGRVQEAAEGLTQGLVEGIIMHSEILKLTKEIDKAFGMVVALQVFLSSGTAVALLLQLALSDELSFMASMKIILFVFALFCLLGLFLCNTGEITYQASLLSEAIFYCGWHACPPRVGRRNVRKIVHVALMQANRPIVMKAFKMLNLTYATFLQVVRSTYSVFALFYAQNK